MLYLQCNLILIFLSVDLYQLIVMDDVVKNTEQYRTQYII